MKFLLTILILLIGINCLAKDFTTSIKFEDGSIHYTEYSDLNGNLPNAIAVRFWTNFNWSNANGNILINHTNFPTLTGGDTVFIPSKSGGYRSFSFANIGSESQGSYIVIYFQTGSFITPDTGGNLFANSMDNSNWVHIYGLNMSTHVDPLMFSYQSTGYSHFIFWDSITLRSMPGIFPSGPPSSSLANWGGGTDTVNCFYKWRFHKLIVDSINGTNSGQTALWVGNITKNQTWVNLRIDSSFFGDYSSVANPSSYIHAENVWGLFMDHDSLWNLGGTFSAKTGHAALIYAQMNYFDIHNCWFGPNNFGDEVRNLGAGDIPSMKTLFLSWDPTYNGRSRFHDNVIERKQKYPVVETRTDPGDTAALSPWVRMRTCPEVWNISAFRMAMGVGHQYYNSSIIDCYENDSLFLKNSFICGPTDTLWNVVTSQGTNAIITIPNGPVTVWDTASNRFDSSFALSGLNDSTKFIPKLNSKYYNQGVSVPSYIGFDYYNNTVPTSGRASFGLNTGVDIGAVQLQNGIIPPPTILNYFLLKRGRRVLFK